VDVDVGVVDVQVPAEHRPDEPERPRVIEQEAQLRAVRHRREPVHRAVAVDFAAPTFPFVHPEHRVARERGLVLGERARDDQVAVGLELGALGGGHLERRGWRQLDHVHASLRSANRWHPR
jgi:hypothetical protein